MAAVGNIGAESLGGASGGGGWGTGVGGVGNQGASIGLGAAPGAFADLAGPGPATTTATETPAEAPADEPAPADARAAAPTFGLGPQGLAPAANAIANTIGGWLGSLGYTGVAHGAEPAVTGGLPGWAGGKGTGEVEQGGPATAGIGDQGWGFGFSGMGANQGGLGLGVAPGTTVGGLTDTGSLTGDPTGYTGNYGNTGKGGGPGAFGGGWTGIGATQGGQMGAVAAPGFAGLSGMQGGMNPGQVGAIGGPSYGVGGGPMGTGGWSAGIGEMGTAGPGLGIAEGDKAGPTDVNSALAAEVTGTQTLGGVEVSQEADFGGLAGATYGGNKGGSYTANTADPGALTGIANPTTGPTVDPGLTFGPQTDPFSAITTTPTEPDPGFEAPAASRGSITSEPLGDLTAAPAPAAAPYGLGATIGWGGVSPTGVADALGLGATAQGTVSGQPGGLTSSGQQGWGGTVAGAQAAAAQAGLDAAALDAQSLGEQAGRGALAGPEDAFSGKGGQFGGKGATGSWGEQSNNLGLGISPANAQTYGAFDARSSTPAENVAASHAADFTTATDDPSLAAALGDRANALNATMAPTGGVLGFTAGDLSNPGFDAWGVTGTLGGPQGMTMAGPGAFSALDMAAAHNADFSPAAPGTTNENANATVAAAHDALAAQTAAQAQAAQQAAQQAISAELAAAAQEAAPAAAPTDTLTAADRGITAPAPAPAPTPGLAQTLDAQALDAQALSEQGRGMATKGDFLGALAGKGDKGGPPSQGLTNQEIAATVDPMSVQSGRDTLAAAMTAQQAQTALDQQAAQTMDQQSLAEQGKGIATKGDFLGAPTPAPTPAPAPALAEQNQGRGDRGATTPAPGLTNQEIAATVDPLSAQYGYQTLAAQMTAQQAQPAQTGLTGPQAEGYSPSVSVGGTPTGQPGLSGWADTLGSQYAGGLASQAIDALNTPTATPAPALAEQNQGRGDKGATTPSTAQPSADIQGMSPTTTQDVVDMMSQAQTQQALDDPLTQALDAQDRANQAKGAPVIASPNVATKGDQIAPTQTTTPTPTPTPAPTPTPTPTPTPAPTATPSPGAAPTPASVPGLAGGPAPVGGLGGRTGAGMSVSEMGGETNNQQAERMRQQVQSDPASFAQMVQAAPGVLAGLQQSFSQEQIDQIFGEIGFSRKEQNPAPPDDSGTLKVEQPQQGFGGVQMAQGGLVDHPGFYAAGGLSPASMRSYASTAHYSGANIKPAINPPGVHLISSSDVAGRTDRIPMQARTGSFVLPADVVSGLGQGNTGAGAKMWGQMISHSIGPMGIQNAIRQRTLKAPALRGFGARSSTKGFADGGEIGEDLTPIVTAGGEALVDPEIVCQLGGGDSDRGKRVLINSVMTVRGHTIKHLKKLPRPAP
jgi:hypothetical protein